MDVNIVIHTGITATAGGKYLLPTTTAGVAPNENKALSALGPNDNSQKNTRVQLIMIAIVTQGKMEVGLSSCNGIISDCKVLLWFY